MFRNRLQPSAKNASPLWNKHVPEPAPANAPVKWVQQQVLLLVVAQAVVLAAQVVAQAAQAVPNPFAQGKGVN